MERRKFLGKSIAVGATALAAPHVIAKKSIRWKMVTTWPKNFPALGTGANLLAKNIEKMSNGRIKIKVYGAGELVPALGIFDAVSRGTAQMGHGAAYYWKGKHEASQFFAAVPFGLNAQEMNGWLDYGGGQELWNELYSQFNLVPFNAGNTGVQMGGWFNKEIKTLKDFKGLKMRMPGLGAEVLRRLGSTVVTIPGGELFQALKTKAVDASEWVGPYNDLAFGLHKAAKFYYWPGWHEPGATIECFINKKAFESLPSDLKEIVRWAAKASSQDMLAEYTARNGTALVQLVKKHKVILRRFPEPVLKKLGEVSNEVLEEVAKKNAMTKKVYKSFNEFRKNSVNYGKISEEGYSIARALTYRK